MVFEMLVPLHLCDVAWAAWFVSDVRFWKCSRKQVTQLESRQKLPAPFWSVVLKGLKDFGRAALWAVIQLVLLKLSVVLMVSDYRITVISGDNLIAGALPVQPEATPLAATKTTVQMLRLTDLIRGFGEWCHHAVGYWMCSQNLKHGVRVLSSGWAARWRLCGGVLSLATLPVCLS